MSARPRQELTAEQKLARSDARDSTRTMQAHKLHAAAHALAEQLSGPGAENEEFEHAWMLALLVEDLAAKLVDDFCGAK